MFHFFAFSDKLLITALIGIIIYLFIERKEKEKSKRQTALYDLFEDGYYVLDANQNLLAKVKLSKDHTTDFITILLKDVSEVQPKTVGRLKALIKSNHYLLLEFEASDENNGFLLLSELMGYSDRNLPVEAAEGMANKAFYDTVVKQSKDTATGLWREYQKRYFLDSDET